MNKSVSDWGVGNPIAPTRKKIYPSSWLMTSAIGGAVFFTGAMALMWQSFPGLPVPGGSFGANFLYGVKSALNLAWPQAYATEAAAFASHVREFTKAHGHPHA